MDTNASTGYNWTYNIINDDILDINHYDDYSDCETDVVGCGGKTIYNIKGKKAGKSQMILEYCFMGEINESCKTAIYEFTVDKKLNVSEIHYGSYFNKS